METKIVKVTDKGQISLPISMRENAGIAKGDELIIIQDEGMIILEKMSTLTKKFKEDLAFAKKTKEAWKRYEDGKFYEMDSKEFLKEIEKW